MALRIDVLSLFPRVLEPFLEESIVGRAIKYKRAIVHNHDLRQWATDRRRTVDDRPFGGGPGMVLMVEPVVAAIEDLCEETTRRIFLCPDGRPFDQSKARELAGMEHILLLCGHYEGIDDRIRRHWIDEEISIGDYVLTNGILPAAVVIDAVVRQIPEVLGNGESTHGESFSHFLLAHPQFSRPKTFRQLTVPEILLGGNHKKIDEWRRWKQLLKTARRRADLWENFKNYERQSQKNFTGKRHSRPGELL